jgi:malonyl-CoA O-methyltransferase
MRQFSRAARSYDNHAEAQRLAAARLFELLPDAVAGNVLEIGCGTGILTTRLIERYGESSVLAIDSSEDMTRALKARLGGSSRVSCTEFSRFSSKDLFSLVVGSSSFHWFRPFDELIKRTTSLLEKGGVLAFAIMLDGTLFELQASRRVAAPQKAIPVTLPNFFSVKSLLETSGLVVRVALSESQKLVYPCVSDFLRSLSRLGVNASLDGKDRLNRGELEILSRIYNERFGSEKGIPATYNVGYFIAIN